MEEEKLIDYNGKKVIVLDLKHLFSSHYKDFQEELDKSIRNHNLSLLEQQEYKKPTQETTS